MLALLSLPFLILASGAPAATIQAGLAFVLIMETLTFLQYLAALSIDGRCDWRFLSAAVLIKPYNLFLGVVRLRSIRDELSAKRNSW